MPEESLRDIMRGGTTGKYDRSKIIPRDEWGHKSQINELEIHDMKTLKDIITKDLSMGFIEDDLYIRILNERMGLTIVPLFQTSWKQLDANGVFDKDNPVQEIAEWLFSRVISDIKLTRSRQGMERMLQGNVLGNLLAKAMGRIGGVRIPREKEEEGLEIPYG